MTSTLNVSKIEPLSGSGTIHVGSDSSNTVSINTTTQDVTLANDLIVTGASTATGGLNVGTIKEATGSNTAMTIDSSGQVLLSAIPFMRMTTTVSTNIVKDTGQTITPFNNVLDSRGITLNTSTYKFQVPVAGLYHFSGAVRWNNASSYLWWRVVDGSGNDASNGMYVLNNGNSTSFITTAGSMVVPLAASTDYQIQFGDGADNTTTTDPTGQTFMNIYLVGAN